MKHLLVVALLCSVACEGRIVAGEAASTPTPATPAGETPTTSSIDQPHYAMGQCEGVPSARTFVGLDGSRLEAGRVNASTTLDQRHTRTWEVASAWGADMNDKLGYWLASADVAATAMVPVRSSGGIEFWYTVPPMGALELYSQFRVSFLMCQRMLKTPPDASQRQAFVLSPSTGELLSDFQAAPTAASAPRRCESMMRRFWKLVPTPEQVAACTQFAVEETESLATTPAERWAYVCAALLTSTGATTQ